MQKTLQIATLLCLVYIASSLAFDDPTQWTSFERPKTLQTYRYTIPRSKSQITSIYSPELDINLTFVFNDTPTLIINDEIILHFFNDSEWDQNHQISTEIHSEHRRLLNAYGYGHGQYGGHRMNRFRQNRGPKQYHAVRRGMKFQAAEQYCKSSHQGNLVTIQTQYENERVAQMCGELGQDWNCWIGLKRPFRTWLDGSIVNYDEWMPGEPNNFGNNEHCTEIMSAHARWNDENCANKRSFICQSYPGQNNLNEKWKHRRRASRKQRKMRRVRREERRDERVWRRILRKERYKRYMRRMRRRDMQRAREIEEKRRERWRKHLRALRRKRREKMKQQFVREMEMEKRRDAAYHLLNKLIESAVMDHGAGSLPKGALKTLATLKGQSGRRLLNEDIENDHLISRCKILDELIVCVRYGNDEWIIELITGFEKSVPLMESGRFMETLQLELNDAIAMHGL